MKNVLFWICFAACFDACVWDPPIDTKLKLVNSSSKPILVCYNVDVNNYTINGLSAEYNPFHEIQEADTTRGYRVGLMKDNPNYILPGDTISAHLGMGKWESHINHGKLWVYVFTPETVLTTDWKKILQGKKWDKVYSLTLNQVESRDWIIHL